MKSSDIHTASWLFGTLPKAIIYKISITLYSLSLKTSNWDSFKAFLSKFTRKEFTDVTVKESFAFFFFFFYSFIKSNFLYLASGTLWQTWHQMDNCQLAVTSWQLSTFFCNLVRCAAAGLETRVYDYFSVYWYFSDNQYRSSESCR